jgi:hypothetical protein
VEIPEFVNLNLRTHHLHDLDSQRSILSHLGSRVISMSTHTQPDV